MTELERLRDLEQRCRIAGLLDVNGELRRIHGCPVILKDGAFCLGNKPVYHPDLMFGELPMPLSVWKAGNGVWYGRDFTGDYQERSRLLNKCFSTPEAALGAKA